MLRISSLYLLVVANLACGYRTGDVEVASSKSNHTKLIPSILTSRDGQDPSDFSWVKSWAAIGDSYTAGIGSGRQLGGIFHNRDDWYCSRYDEAYPVVVNKAFGSAVEKFQFEACSGDRSVQIYDQVQKMDGDLDLVIMTAGGNDLCLASMLKACIFLPFQGEDKCQAVIDQANKNIDTILKPNIRQILASLNKKMNKNSVVVYNGYAQFFNTDNDVCTNDENWTLKFKWFVKGLKLTIDRRKKFNDLVVGINGAIKDVVGDLSKNGSLNYKIAFADWDRWPREGVEGQFCHPSSSGRYPDDKQPDLQFFKEDTYVQPIIHDELKKRTLQAKEEAEFQAWLRAASEENIYNTLLFKSADPKAEVLHKLDRRAPAPPNCPGDGSFDPTLGLGLPDTFGKLFHPNELGHATIASYALQTVMDLRAEVLGVDAPACTKVDTFTCYQNEGRKAYAHPDQLNENYKDFCKNVDVPEHTKGWEYKKTYFKDTPDEQQFKISLGDAMDYNEKECLDSMDRIINGCDGNDDKNPMDWKFGGQWKRGEYTYEVAPQRDHRPWPVIQKPDGHCKGTWKGLLSSYTIYGVGFSDYDYGQKTILPAMKGCLGLGITGWKFKYYDEPTDDGWEWKLTFHTPVFVNARCFKNNKVVKSAGGWTNGCGGSDA